MRLVEYLIHLLKAQAETLNRLATIFGDDELFGILEAASETGEPALEGAAPSRARRTEIRAADFLPADGWEDDSPYLELEEAVRGLKLSPSLEFHLWAYPHYRQFVEADLDLGSRIPGPRDAGRAGTVPDLGLRLVELAVAQAGEWARTLPLPPGAGLQAERAAHAPWLRFRTEVLKRVGRRPLGPVY